MMVVAPPPIGAPGWLPFGRLTVVSASKEEHMEPITSRLGAVTRVGQAVGCALVFSDDCAVYGYRYV